MTNPEGERKPLEQLDEIRRTLQDAGITLLQAATAAVNALAKDTLTATKAAIGAADDTLAAAEEKVRKIRAELRKQS